MTEGVYLRRCKNKTNTYIWSIALFHSKSCFDCQNISNESVSLHTYSQHFILEYFLRIFGYLSMNKPPKRETL